MDWQETAIRDLVEDNDDEDSAILAVISTLSTHRVPSLLHSPLRNTAFVEQLLHQDTLLYMTCGTTREQFNQLLSLLRDNNALDSRYIMLSEQLLIFLYLCRTGSSNRTTQVQFARSADTVSKVFHYILAHFTQLHSTLVLPPVSNQTQHRIISSPKFYPYFKDCIGALDGTHIPVFLPIREQAAWRDYRNNLSQNVLAVCSFDSIFTFIHPGWEGSAHDGLVIQDAIGKGLLQITPGKYWLADAGYASTPYTMVPYPQTRYHLKEWSKVDLRPANYKELFNLRHSTLRTTIERCFGILKNKFQILSQPAKYSIETQVDIVRALTGIYNVLKQDPNDIEFRDPDLPTSIDDTTAIDSSPLPGQAQSTQMNGLRDQIALQMWNDYQEIVGI